MNTAPPNGAPGAQRPAAGLTAPKRKKPAVDPFFSGPKVRAPAARPKINGQPGKQSNRLTAPPRALQSTTPNLLRSTSPSRQVSDAERVSGFTDPQVIAGNVPYKDYRVVVTKKEVLDGLRFHVLQLGGTKSIDIRSEAEFPKPARLVRRDPNAVPQGQPKDEAHDAKDGLKPEEREELNRRKEQRQKEREANLAQIAPSQSTAKKVPNFKKKVQQVFRPELTDQDKKRIQLNYEEKLPWHLEDFDGKNVFVGQNHAGSANVHLGLVQETAADGSTVFRALPIEKVYQFNPKRKVLTTMSIEEAEAAMKRRGTEPDWLLSLRHERIREAQQEVEHKKSRGLFSGAQMSHLAGRQGEEADLDFEVEEDFADDEEGALFEEKDEDEKLAEKKIKEDLLTANIFDLKDIKEYDEAEEKEQREEEARRKNNKKIRKALEKRERNYTLASDSEFSSDTDSEEERARLEQERLNNVKKEEEEEGKKSNIPSGTNTPSGRKEKHGTASDREGAMKKSTSSNKLKRPGSPNLSDASGTDTSVRKKHKSRHASSTQPTPGTSRPHSPANVPSSSAPLGKARRRAGGSDTEMTGMHSDREGAMSDGGKRRLKVPAGSASPTSRQTSPVPANAAATISRPTSTGPGGRASPAPGAEVTAPTPQEIRDVINQAPGGRISIPDFLKHFKMNRNSGYVVPPEVHSEFTALMKQMTSLDKATKMLYLK